MKIDNIKDINDIEEILYNGSKKDIEKDLNYTKYLMNIQKNVEVSK